MFNPGGRSFSILTGENALSSLLKLSHRIRDDMAISRITAMDEATFNEFLNSIRGAFSIDGEDEENEDIFEDDDEEIVEEEDEDEVMEEREEVAGQDADDEDMENMDPEQS